MGSRPSECVIDCSGTPRLYLRISVVASSGVHMMTSASILPAWTCVMTLAVYVSAWNPVQVTSIFGCAALNSSTTLNHAAFSAGRYCSQDIRRSVVLPPDLLWAGVDEDENPATAARARPAPPWRSWRRLTLRFVLRATVSLGSLSGISASPSTRQGSVQHICVLRAHVSQQSAAPDV